MLEISFPSLRESDLNIFCFANSNNNLPSSFTRAHTYKAFALLVFLLEICLPNYFFFTYKK